MELRDGQTSHWGLCCATLEWWKDEARKWNFSELCITAQCHRAFLWALPHTRNDSPWQRRNIAWQHPLLLKKGWAGSLTVAWSDWAAVNSLGYLCSKGDARDWVDWVDWHAGYISRSIACITNSFLKDVLKNKNKHMIGILKF